MNRRGGLLLAAGLALSLVGCAFGTSPAPAALSSARIRVVPAAYALQTAGVHRNTAEDVFEYEVSLERMGETAYEAIEGVDPVEVSPSMEGGPSATFTQLTAGRYRVSVTAYADEDHATKLNASPARQELDLTAGALTDASVTVALDGTDLDLRASGSVTAPTEPGGYATPEPAEGLSEEP